MTLASGTAAPSKPQVRPHDVLVIGAGAAEGGTDLLRRLAVAGGLAALTFVLKAPFSGVVPGAASAGPVVLLPALAAAVVVVSPPRHGAGP